MTAKIAYERLMLITGIDRVRTRDSRITFRGHPRGRGKSYTSQLHILMQQAINKGAHTIDAFRAAANELQARGGISGKGSMLPTRIRAMPNNEEHDSMDMIVYSCNHQAGKTMRTGDSVRSERERKRSRAARKRKKGRNVE